MMAVKKGLGRGLDALLGDYTVEPAAAGVQQVDVYLVDTNLDQPRKTFDEDKLSELAASIERHGMVQPIIARRNGERYTIIAGERRFRAARIAGMSSVPLVVRDMEDAEVMEVALVENIQREDLNPIEEAAAIRFLMQQHDLTQEEVATRLSKSRPAIANAVRLLNLPDAVQDMLRDGRLQAGHARALAALKDETAIIKLAGEIAGRGLSVRDAEAKVKALAEAKIEKPKQDKPKPVNSDLVAAEERLRNRLGTKVSIVGNETRGRVIIEYFSKEDLQGVYDTIIKG
ncbi:MAG: ParB/RepB/Spo0J family partition protein [Clostridia bacterium]